MAAVASMQRLRRVGKSDAAIYRNWSIASEFVRAAIDIRKGQLETADWDLQPRTPDLPDPDKGLMARIRELLNSPNPGDESFGTFISAVAEDIMVLDAGSIEKERKFKGEILWLWPTDGAFIKVDRFWNGDPKMPRYYFEPQPSWSVPLLNSDLVYMMIHRRSNLPIGISYLEILKQAIDAELSGSLVNARRVVQNAPEGVMDMGENARIEQVQSFSSFFQSELAGNSVLGFWGGTKGAKFIDFQRRNVDMQFLQWLEFEVRKIAVVFQLSIQDLGNVHDVNRANADVQQENSEDRGLRTLLTRVQDYITAEVCGDAYWGGKANNIAFRFRSATDRQSLAKAQIKKITLAGMPMESINSARIDMGKPPIGDPSDATNPFNKLMADTPLGLVTLDKIPTAWDVTMGKAAQAAEAKADKPAVSAGKKEEPSGGK